MSDSVKAVSGTGGSSSANVTITEDFKGSVVFNSESAGYKNAVGMYTYSADGTITGVKILWANASLKGSGGDLAANKSAVDVALQAGDKVGFFVVPDSYSQKGMAEVLNSTSGSFKFVDANGKPGNINGGSELKLVQVNPNGVETVVKSAYGTSLFHSTDDGSKGLNGDKLNHVVTTVDPAKGTIKIGFEDLKGGGDKDFDDSVITINVGSSNAKRIADGSADKVVAERAAAEKAAIEKAALEAAQKSGSDKNNSDDDKHDGRGHGDGDHNDDGHDDNGQGPVKKAEKEAAEKAAAEKLAAEKAAAEKLAAEKAAAEKAAAEKAAAEKLAAEKAAAEKAAAEKLAAEQAAAEKLAAEKAAAEKAAAEKAAAEKAAADQVAADKAAAQKLAAEKLAAEYAAEKQAAAAAEDAKHAAGEMLVDGSFEQADVGHNTWGHQAVVGGWHSDTEVEVWGRDFYGVKATDGVKVAELDYDHGLSNMYQEVATVSGQSYTFTFDYAQRSDAPAAGNTVQVFWNGELVGSVDPASTDWSHASFQVVGTGGSDRIEFREEAGDNDSLGGLIDNASLRATPVVVPADALMLKAVDVAKGITSELLNGGNKGDELSGGVGNDEVYGHDGNDVLNGDTSGRVTAALSIDVSMIDADNSETVSLVIAGMPKGAILSAGHDNGDGTWSLSVEELKGLNVTADDGSVFKLSVTATATDVTGAVMMQHADINVVFDNGNEDLVVGGRGNDNITGGAGNDVLYGGGLPTGAPPHVVTVADNDIVHGNDGDDFVYGNSGDDQVFGDAGNDFVSGGRGDDFVSGGDGDDVMKGNSGNDMMNGEAGDDQMTGGSGFDTLDFSMSMNGMTVDMSKHVAIGMGNDTINGFEKIIGSEFNDVMIGDSHDNVFVGGAGDDVMRGAKGNDTFTGGTGNDVFQWQKSDVFTVKTGVASLDHITDFEVGDKLELTGFFKAGTSNIANLLQVTDGADGTTVSVKFGGQFHDVVVLDGVHGLTATDMLKDGMLLVA